METGKQKEYFLFLECLRLSGATNMLGAVPYLLDEFPELTKTGARGVLMAWMESFSS